MKLKIKYLLLWQCTFVSIYVVVCVSSNAFIFFTFSNLLTLYQRNSSMRYTCFPFHSHQRNWIRFFFNIDVTKKRKISYHRQFMRHKNLKLNGQSKCTSQCERALFLLLLISKPIGQTICEHSNSS